MRIAKDFAILGLKHGLESGSQSRHNDGVVCVSVVAVCVLGIKAFVNFYASENALAD